MRVLHLVEPVAGDEGLLACAHALSIDSARHEAWIIGDDRAERRAWACGVITTDRVSPRPSSLARLARARFRNEDPPDVVQCWSLGALASARRVFGSGPGAPARVAVLAHPPTDPAALLRHLDESALATGREILAAMDLTTRHHAAALLPRGRHRWLSAIRFLEPPAFVSGGPLPHDRAALRTMLGLDDAAPIIGLLADPPEAADAHHVIFSAGVLHAAGHRTVSLIRRGARAERRAVRYLRAHASHWGLAFADLSLSDLVAASDVCLIDLDRRPAHPPAETCGPIALSLALSMGVPIAAPPCPLLEQMVGDPWPVHIGRSAGRGRIAVPVADILESPNLRAELASASRAWCDRARARDGFRTTLSDIWAEAAPRAAPARPVPEPATIPPG